MAEDQTPNAEGAEAKEGPAPRKELEGFQVTRSAPASQDGGNPMLVPFVIVVVLALGGGFAAVKFGGSDDDGATGATTGETGGTGTGETTKEFPADEEVPDYVWDRLEFLEGEGNVEKALEVSEEAHALTPNAKLRVKMAQYRKELGLDVADLTLPQALQGARAALSRGKYAEAIDLASVAIDLSEDTSAEAYFIRGSANAKANNELEAAEDLNSALELGYEPAAKAEALLEKYE